MNYQNSGREMLPFNWSPALHMLNEKNLQISHLYKPKGADKVSEATFTRMKSSGKASYNTILKVSRLLDLQPKDLIFDTQRPRVRRAVITCSERATILERLSLAYKILFFKF